MRGKSKVDFDQLQKVGYSITKFKNIEPLIKLQNLIKKSMPFPPTEWHDYITDKDRHFALIAQLTTEIASSGFASMLIMEQIHLLKELIGPDIDIQTIPHFRVSRPFQEKDLVDWHRDTFYGGSAWQLNYWFPVFELQNGAGLLVIPGSHKEPSRNIREIPGNLYPGHMEDDSIVQLKNSQAELLRPAVGEGILFFGCSIHRAVNHSAMTRISLDLRIKNAHIFDSIDSRDGYFKPFCRGLVGSVVSDFLKHS